MDEAVSLSSEFITIDNDHIILSINDVTMPSSKMPEQELGRKLVDVTKTMLALTPRLYQDAIIYNVNIPTVLYIVVCRSCWRKRGLRLQIGVSSGLYD